MVVSATWVNEHLHGSALDLAALHATNELSDTLTLKSGFRGGNGDGGSPHCGFRRYIHFRRGLTLQMKFVYPLNSLKCQLPSQSFLAKLCVS